MKTIFTYKYIKADKNNIEDVVSSNDFVALLSQKIKECEKEIEQKKTEVSSLQIEINLLEQKI